MCVHVEHGESVLFISLPSVLEEETGADAVTLTTVIVKMEPLGRNRMHLHTVYLCLNNEACLRGNVGESNELSVELHAIILCSGRPHNLLFLEGRSMTLLSSRSFGEPGRRRTVSVTAHRSVV